RGDHSHTAADQVSYQCRQAIVSALQPVVLDHHVLAFHKAGFVEAFAERGHITGGDSGRPGADKPDHRRSRTLGARFDRPASDPAAENDDHFAPTDEISHRSYSRGCPITNNSTPQVGGLGSQAVGRTRSSPPPPFSRGRDDRLGGSLQLMRKYLLSFSRSSRGLNGFETKSSQPAARALFSSSIRAYEVTMIIGILRIAGSALIRRVAS